MALSATMYRISLSVSDVDRGVYASEELRLAQHPSESLRHLILRALAFTLAFEEGLAMGRGVSSPDEPALAARDPTGRIVTWIEVGAPSRDRLHRAAKQADRVLVFTTGDTRALFRELAGDFHRKDELALFEVDEALVAALGEGLQRTDAWQVTRTGGELFVTTQGRTCSGAVRQRSLVGG